MPLFVDANEDPALARAALDLARDLEAVLGVSSPLERDRAALGDRPAIVITTQARASGSERDPPLSGSEEHMLSVRGARVVLKGADVRGAIYAAYAFSDEVLDVPPLAFWARWRPARRSALELADDWERRFAPAQVRWRAAFPNNTDFLRGWARASGRDSDEVLFETLLRLKMNTLDVGEALLDGRGEAHPRVLAARARGLAVTSAHLGSFRDWPSGVAAAPRELLLSNVAGLEEFWAARVSALSRARIEMIWGISFRGAGDTGFASSFPDAPSEPALQGLVVQAMLERQLRLVRELSGDPHPLVRSEIYSELARLYADGHFRPPEDPDLIWHFANETRDHYPGPDLLDGPQPPHRRAGYYMNLQFTSTGSHYAEGEGPWKMARNFALAQARVGAPLSITKVNVGNVREFAVNLAAHAELAWRGFDSPADAVVHGFFARYFGAAGEAVERLYRALLASYWEQRPPTLPGFERQFIFHDLRLGQAAARLLALLEAERKPAQPLDADRFRIDERGAPSQLDALIAGVEASAARRAVLGEEARCLRATLPEPQLAFFDDIVTNPAALLLSLDRAVASLARAVQLAPPRLGPDTAAGPHLAAAALVLGELSIRLSAAEHAPFAGWYSRLEILDVRALAERARALALRAGSSP